jgi:hypothetical protein
MKKILVAVFAFSALYMSSCKTSGGGDPKAVLTSFFDAMAKKDIAAARKLATADSKQMFDIMEMGMKMDPGVDNELKETFDRSRMEFGETKITGDKATVNAKDAKSGESVNFILKKESGSWKVAIDLETMKNIAAEKMKEKGMSEEEIRNLEEEMKNINLDSIKSIIEKQNK